MLVSRVRDSLNYSGRDIRLAALLIARVFPIRVLFAPGDPGAAPGIGVDVSLTRDTSVMIVRPRRDVARHLDGGDMQRRQVAGALAGMVVVLAGIAGCGGTGGNSGAGNATGGAAGASGGATPAAPKTLTLAVVPKGSTHEHWARVRIGAEKAAAELTAAGTPVRILWKGPIREDDREQQLQVVEGFISQGVQGIVLAPLDSRALKRPVEEAAQAGIPTVVFDSALEPPHKAVSYVSTDNGKGGRLAGRRMGELLKGKGTVLMLRYQEGSAATEEREAGFLDELKTGFPGITVMSSDQYAGATRDTAKRASENLLNRFATRVDGIFASNESATAGMLLALQDIGKAGAITFVGFDYSASFLEPLRKGELKGFVVQNPVNMGYLSTKTMVAHLQKQPVPASVDTGVELVTLENLQDPKIQAVINPR
jgi:ribose transport system substrate-binding protein